MDPTELTCAKCGAKWKLIKASADQIVCPYCKAPVEIAASENPTETIPPETTSPASAAQPVVAPESVAPTPAPTAPTEPIAPLQEHSAPDEHSIPATVREFNVPETEADDYDDSADPRRRGRGMSPVAKTILILMLLIFLAPVALFVLLFVVCVIAMAAR